MKYLIQTLNERLEDEEHPLTDDEIISIVLELVKPETPLAPKRPTLFATMYSRIGDLFFPGAKR